MELTQEWEACFFLKGVFFFQRFPPTLVTANCSIWANSYHFIYVTPQPESSSILGIFPCKGLTDPAEIPSGFRNAHLCEGRRKGPETTAGPEGLAWREGGVASWIGKTQTGKWYMQLQIYILYTYLQTCLHTYMYTCSSMCIDLGNILIIPFE